MRFTQQKTDSFNCLQTIAQTNRLMRTPQTLRARARSEAPSRTDCIIFSDLHFMSCLFFFRRFATNAYPRIFSVLRYMFIYVWRLYNESYTTFMANIYNETSGTQPLANFAYLSLVLYKMSAVTKKEQCKKIQKNFATQG